MMTFTLVTLERSFLCRCVYVSKFLPLILFLLHIFLLCGLVLKSERNEGEKKKKNEEERKDVVVVVAVVLYLVKYHFICFVCRFVFVEASIERTKERKKNTTNFRFSVVEI